jgi:hypothetical protein
MTPHAFTAALRSELHFRGKPGEHVRGWWVVDLMLGKN